MLTLMTELRAHEVIVPSDHRPIVAHVSVGITRLTSRGGGVGIHHEKGGEGEEGEEGEEGRSGDGRGRAGSGRRGGTRCTRHPCSPPPPTSSLHVFTCPLVHMFTCPHVRLSTCSIVQLFACSLVHVFTCPLVHMFACSLVHLSTCSLVRLFACSLVRSFARSIGWLHIFDEVAPLTSILVYDERFILCFTTRAGAATSLRERRVD